MVEARQRAEWNHTSALYFATEKIEYVLAQVHHDPKQGSRPEPPEFNSINPFVSAKERAATERAKVAAKQLQRELHDVRMAGLRGKDAVTQHINQRFGDS